MSNEKRESKNVRLDLNFEPWLSRKLDNYIKIISALWIRGDHQKSREVANATKPIMDQVIKYTKMWGL